VEKASDDSHREGKRASKTARRIMVKDGGRNECCVCDEFEVRRNDHNDRDRRRTFPKCRTGIIW
jgi:hypothetical protein